MVTWSDVDDDAVLHTGGRRCAGKHRPMVVFAELAVVMTVGSVLWWPQSTLTAGQGVAVWAGFTGFFLVLTACAGYGRVTITQREIRVRTCRGEVRIPRGEVAQAVYGGGCDATGTGEGYIVLRDASGARLWGTLTDIWTDETVRALLATAPEVVRDPEDLEPQPEAHPWD